MNRHIITIAAAIIGLGIGYTVGSSGSKTPTSGTVECDSPAARVAAQTAAATPAKEEPIVLPEVSEEDAAAAFEKAKPLFLAKKYEDGIEDLMTAAKGGIPYAEYFLGMSYQSGLGVEASNTDAYYWLTLAQIHRIKAARTPMNQLSRVIKNEEKEAAKKMVQEWKINQKAIQRSKVRLAAQAAEAEK